MIILITLSASQSKRAYDAIQKSVLLSEGLLIHRFPSNWIIDNMKRIDQSCILYVLILLFEESNITEYKISRIIFN